MQLALVRYDVGMWWRRIVSVVFALFLISCTKANPAKDCTDGTCSDPSYPFCDVSGAVAGEPGACIASACTANKFFECRGNTEVRCNADGTNYNLSACDRGCDPNANGCRLCSPGETACTNGQVATCDASGAATVKETCPLGCFETEPRCREIAPSNGLAMYFDMVASPPALTMEDGTFNVDSGEVFENGSSLSIPSFQIPAPANGVPLRVFVVSSALITRASVVMNGTAGGPAFVLLSRGDITLIGQLSVNLAGTGDGLALCNAGGGSTPNTCLYSSSASGGGAFATNGAKGGDVVNASNQIVIAAGAGGIANGSATLSPLRGGCSGGSPTDWNNHKYNIRDGFGGGAVQLASRTRIIVEGVVDAKGQDASGDNDLSPDNTQTAYSFGGGAGGAILLEAPDIHLGATAVLNARGGNGGGMSYTDNYYVFAAGGIGASPGSAATAGTSIACNGAKPVVAGGGGGGLGRIRINTRDGTYMKSNSTIEGGAVSTATLATR